VRVKSTHLAPQVPTRQLTDANHDRRTQFTEEDEQNLANWIATKIPYKETGGRTGNRLYQQLCELVQA
jgi:glycosyltransferase A (GT-A) superfamily protein (DUF2064 family)